jgi:seryl-tRNA synthetase
MAKTQISYQLQDLINEARQIQGEQTSRAMELESEIAQSTAELIQRIEQIAEHYKDSKARINQRLDNLRSMFLDIPQQRAEHMQPQPTSEQVTALRQQETIEWLDKLSKRNPSRPRYAEVENRDRPLETLQVPRRYAEN